MAIIHRRQDKDKRVFRTFCQFWQSVLFFIPQQHTRRACPPGLTVRRPRRPGTGVCPARGPGGASSCWQTKFLSQGAGGALGQKRSNGPADQPAGWARGGCGGTCRGQVSEQPRGAGYAGHDRREAAGVSPRHYPVSLFSAGFGPLGPKTPKFPDIAAKRAGPGG